MTNYPLSWPKLPRAVAGVGLSGKLLWFLAVAAFAPFAHSQVPERVPARRCRIPPRPSGSDTNPRIKPLR